MGFVRGNDRRNPAEQGQSEPRSTSAVTPGGPRTLDRNFRQSGH